MRRHVALIPMLLVAAPALAFDTSKLGQEGSLFLSDIKSVIDKAPALRREINQALAQVNKKADDLICTGMRFPGSWVHLGGERVAPYACDFSGKWLQIKTTVRVTGRSRQVYDEITPAAMKNATKVSETNPQWQWTTEEPK